jgi:hypothetical protein
MLEPLVEDLPHQRVERHLAPHLMLAGLSRRTFGRPNPKQRYNASNDANARFTVDGAARRSTCSQRRKSRAA